MGETRKSSALLVAATTIALLCSPVLAEGLIRIDPHGSYYGQPIMLSSPATFSVDVQSDGPAYDPHIFLVMTKDCYDGLTGDVEVTWTGGSVTIHAADWHMETVNSVKVPPGCTPGAAYTVASLKDHLVTTEAIYWAFESFLAAPITTTPQEFTVTLPSSNPRMLVYALGISEGEELFNLFVPPTQPGFVVPEVATILLVTASLSALALYAVKRRKM